jgi:hypothetical protein
MTVGSTAQGTAELALSSLKQMKPEKKPMAVGLSVDNVFCRFGAEHGGSGSCFVLHPGGE